MNLKTDFSKLITRRWSPLFILMCLPGLIAAAQPIDETREFGPDDTLHVSNIKGEIEVRGWDRSEIHVTGMLGDGAEGLEIARSGQTLRVEVRYPRNGRGVEESVLELMVPRGARVEVDTVSADIEISELASPRLEATSVSGEIDIDSTVEHLVVESVSGDIEFTGHAARSRISSVSGDIEARRLAGELSVTTVSGVVILNAVELTEARFETVSGDMELAMTLAPNADIVVESLSADIELDLPSSVSATCETETYSGRIRSDKGTVEKAKYGPHKRLNFVAGDGSGRIRVESFSGDVTIRTDDD